MSGFAARAAFRTVSATTAGPTAVCMTSFTRLFTAARNITIRIKVVVPFKEVPVERHLGIGGLDDHDPDPPRAQLMVERF
jgi:hypothetical protein